MTSLVNRFIIIHRIYDEGNELIVEHRFFGATLEKVLSIYKAHRKTDSFLRDCDDKGEWIAPGGRPHVKCRPRIWLISPDFPNQPITINMKAK